MEVSADASDGGKDAAEEWREGFSGRLPDACDGREASRGEEAGDIGETGDAVAPSSGWEGLRWGRLGEEGLDCLSAVSDRGNDDCRGVG